MDTYQRVLAALRGLIEDDALHPCYGIDIDAPLDLPLETALREWRDAGFTLPGEAPPVTPLVHMESIRGRVLCALAENPSVRDSMLHRMNLSPKQWRAALAGLRQRGLVHECGIDLTTQGRQVVRQHGSRR
jgi:hypothetical protein